jgi:hypothetical protein|eukprot:CAMPEP_0198210034 /NCGR_PEP_ID=MMETSP1445-20131203/18744_1 /TAXON_ID=36898 /ORGANISM="Pyramimonas sp., Strain CCMP2087" /LENGTH=78 /DNA_ID=CAMNT_0043883983 /DNA_START=107 /DNA_END=343 /DNA_ORIENTATION=+
MAVDDGPIGWLEPVIMFALLAFMMGVLFGIAKKFRKDKMSVSRNPKGHSFDSDYGTDGVTEGEDDDEDEDEDEDEKDK